MDMLIKLIVGIFAQCIHIQIISFYTLNVLNFVKFTSIKLEKKIILYIQSNSG